MLNIITYKTIRSVFRFEWLFSLFFLLVVFSFYGCGSAKTATRENTDYNTTQLPSPVDEVKKDTNDTSDISEPLSEKIDKVSADTIEDPLFRYQWYLKDILVLEGVWSNYRGRGVRIGVVDSGIDAAHPDLIENLDLQHSFRYSDSAHDPSPTLAELEDPFVDETHGTAVAGIIAASQNKEGITGVAPEATLVGLNVFSTGDDTSFASAMMYEDIDISSNSWGVDLSLGLNDDRVVLDAIEAKMHTDPTIFVFAAGNEQSNTVFSSVLNSRFTLVVGAVNSKEKAASYTNFGTNLLCVAPGGDEYDKGIVTTDLVGSRFGYDTTDMHFDVEGNENYDYSDIFIGTSAAVPAVSGAIALMMEVNPDLSYRDVRYIIAHTSKQVDKNDTSWIKNGAGLAYSRLYGFGLIDINASVKMATEFESLPGEYVFHEMVAESNITIPDNNTTGILFRLNVTDRLRLEYVMLDLQCIHPYSGDLKIEVTSPSGTTLTVTDGDTLTQDPYMPWSFGLSGFMDEDAKGEWKIRISDIVEEDSGRVERIRMDFYGVKQ